MAANKVTVSSPGPSGPTGMVYEGTWVTSTAYQYRDVVLLSSNGNLYFCDVAHTAGSITPLNPTEGGVTYWSLFVPAGDALAWATTAKHTQVTDSLDNTGYSSLHYSEKSQDWAVKVDGLVTNNTNSEGVDGSAKAWSIGGTGVSQVALKGSAKEWATKVDGVVDDSGHSAKAWTIGGTGITGQASAGSAKDWATKVDGTVDNANHSAKAWSLGGTGVTDTASAGAAKEWAIEDSGTVDGTSYSAKEYAQGTQGSTGGSAKDYAQKTNGGVSGATSDHSAKAWAVGGTGVTTTASKGDLFVFRYNGSKCLEVGRNLNLTLR